MQVLTDLIRKVGNSTIIPVGGISVSQKRTGDNLWDSIDLGKKAIEEAFGNRYIHPNLTTVDIHGSTYGNLGTFEQPLNDTQMRLIFNYRFLNERGELADHWKINKEKVMLTNPDGIRKI
jgi:hypothetical protein